MSTITDTRPAVAQPRTSRTGGWIRRHPLVAFFVLAYTLSWLAWLPALLGFGGMALVVVGGFGPAVAALLVLRHTGGSVRDWARQIVHWRVPVRFYLYALGLPALLFGLMNLVLAALGESPDLGLAVDRLPAYLSTLAFVAVLGGGLEEPGWRGFGLPRLQQRHRPWVATLLLGFAWGVWHVPLYGPLGWILPMTLAFFYTYLYNRTGSVLLCILLHASFTPALEQLILLPEEAVHGGGEIGTADFVILGTVVLAATVLTVMTRGRLGLRR